MASNLIVKLACIYCRVLPHLEGVVTELGSGWNESIGLHFCVSKHFKELKGLELEQMFQNVRKCLYTKISSFHNKMSSQNVFVLK